MEMSPRSGRQPILFCRPLRGLIAVISKYLVLTPQALRSSRASHAQNNSSSASSTDLTPTTLTPNSRSNPAVFDEGITIFWKPKA
jgi:hypothetical protein